MQEAALRPERHGRREVQPVREETGCAARKSRQEVKSLDLLPCERPLCGRQAQSRTKRVYALRRSYVWAISLSVNR
jgi:hypothetical protein